MADLQERILEYVQRPGYKPLKPISLAKRLGVTKKQLAEFEDALDALINSGRLHEGNRGLIRAQTAPGMLVGILKRTSAGAGYVIPHEKTGAAPQGRAGDIYIDLRDIGDAHTGDEVVVRLSSRRRAAGQRSGRIEEVLARATSTFVGTYLEQEAEGYVQVDGKVLVEPVYVGDPGAKGARPGDVVVIEMLRFPTPYLPGEAVLTQVLGERGEPGVDLQTVIHEFGLPDAFTEEVLEEARLEATRFDETNLDGRRDLTKETLVTIDPADARDFDDAISLTRTDKGHWLLGVHIADVAHFVQPGTVLDREAQLRGNSVYLPGRVLPMLPELISNGLASLQAGKMRYAKSVFIEFTAEGVPVHTEFANSAIKVTKRFAYEDVLPIIRDPEQFRTRVSAKVRALLERMYELAMILRRRRLEKGALVLSMPEVKLDFDKEGRVAGAHAVEHDESHQIIEEFMLAANVAVATELFDRGLVFMRRVHGDPDEMKLKAFAQFVNAVGYPIKRYQSRQELQALLDKVEGQPPERAINFALLRSMKQAEYAGIELGHYALAEEHYLHFTSPIRRYPDLTVHRLVGQLVSGKRRPHGPNDLELAKLGKHCSMTERRADKAERELIKLKLLAYMESRIGEEMDAVITGVERFGVFCQGVEIPVEGLIHISAIDRDDYYYYDEATFSLIGRASGRQYRLGDRVRVSVAHVDVERRQLDFTFIPQTGRPAAPAGDGKSRQEATPARRPSAKRARTAETDGPNSSRRPKKAGRKRRR